MSINMKFFAGLWTLRGYPSVKEEWTLEQKFAEVKRQGFEGIGGRFVPEAPALCRKYDLEYLLTIDADARDYPERLRQATAWNARRINVQLCDHDTPPQEAARTWIDMVALAEELGLEIDLELHRNTATETPEKAYEIADIFTQAVGRTIRFCLDYSHFAVTKHLTAPFAPRLLDRPELLGPVRMLHARPFNGHHAQIPATDGRGGPSRELGAWLEFVGVLWAELGRAVPAGSTLYVCPENGPRLEGLYGLECFPDVWCDAIYTRDRIRELWSRRSLAG